jgi:hypothetical protein
MRPLEGQERKAQLLVAVAAPLAAPVLIQLGFGPDRLHRAVDLAQVVLGVALQRGVQVGGGHSGSLQAGHEGRGAHTGGWVRL